MRSNQLLYTMLALSLGLLSFTNPQPPSKAILTGKVDKQWSNTIKLSSGNITLTDSWIDRLNVGDSLIEIEEDGTFRMEVSLHSPNFYRLTYQYYEAELFLSPRDSLHIDFTADPAITGTTASLNNHLDDLRGMINANRRYIDQLELYRQPAARLSFVLDSLESVYLSAHQAFEDKHAVPRLFAEKVKADISYRNKLCQVAHPAVHMKWTGNQLPLDANYFEVLGKGHFSNPALLKSLDYVLFLDSYLDAQAAGEYKYDIYFEAPMEKIHPKYDEIQGLEAHPKIKDYLAFEHLNRSMDNYGVTYLEDLLPQFRKHCQNDEYIRRIEDRFMAARERRAEPDTIIVYKTVGNVQLEAHVFYPEDFQEGEQRPTYAFFHGGGWSIGIPEWGYKNCKKYRALGMVAISFEYRLIDIHSSNLLDCVRDAKSAILWTRREAASLGVDPDKIVAAGFSAGGHLAACTAILDQYEEPNQGTLSAKPNAIIVHSASYNTTKNDWFSTKSGQRAESISTFHQLDKDLVPGIFFHGTNDHLAPISEFTEFKDKMDALGNEYEYKIFENVGHFFNNAAARKEVGELTEAFLRRLGYIEG